MASQIAEIQRALKGLNTVAKNKIDELTELAKDVASSNAEDFISMIDAQLRVVPSNQKLGYIYLMDSILKNVSQSYSEIISLHISDSFMHIFTTVDETIRISLYKLFITWLYYLPIDLLQELSERVRYHDPYWPALDMYSFIQQPERLNETRYGSLNVDNTLPDQNTPASHKSPQPGTPTNPSLYSRKRPIENGHTESNPAVIIDPRNFSTGVDSHAQHNPHIQGLPNVLTNSINQPPIGFPFNPAIYYHSNVRNVDNRPPLLPPINHGHVNPNFLPPHLRNFPYGTSNVAVNMPRNAPPRPQNTGNILKNIVTSLKQGSYNGTALNPSVKGFHENQHIASNIHTPNLSLINLNKNSLKIYDESIIRFHLTGKMCVSCGRRYPQQATQEYSQHLDWHFQINRRRFSTKLSKQKWFTTTFIDSNMDTPTTVTSNVDLTKKEKIEKTNEINVIKSEPITTATILENINTTTNYPSGKITFTDDPEIDSRSKFPSCMAIVDQVDDDMCAVCKEKFDQFWNEELEEWHYEQAVRIEGSAYHVLCRPKIKSEPEEENNKLVETRKNMDFTKLSSLDLSLFIKHKK